jgi:hypothetical protein
MAATLPGHFESEPDSVESSVAWELWSAPHNMSGTKSTTAKRTCSALSAHHIASIPCSRITVLLYKAGIPRLGAESSDRAMGSMAKELGFDSQQG